MPQEPEASCAGCGAPGTTSSVIPAGQVALHWRRRGRWVCAGCASRSIEVSGKRPVVRLPRRFVDALERCAVALEEKNGYGSRKRGLVDLGAKLSKHEGRCPFCEGGSTTLYLRGSTIFGCRECIAPLVAFDCGRPGCTMLAEHSHPAK
jgi:ribosomal protein L37AE/L43A